MTWLHNNKPVEEIDTKKYKAFVYLITNLVDGRQYIGKKLTESTITRPPLKGQKRKRKIRKESDWREYWSSSDELKADVEKLGEENFHREILHFCTNKGTASYLEMKEQVLNEVLEKPDQWYNGIIQCKVHRSHVKIEGSPNITDTVILSEHAKAFTDKVNPPTEDSIDEEPPFVISDKD